MGGVALDGSTLRPVPRRQERVELIGVTIMQDVGKTSAKKVTALAVRRPLGWKVL
jgi:hypothetical protein